ncbi:extracellular solute-binding protein [Halobaculum sp. MBLA0143]|uniref:extracellular solute-binding protein n=1 Tax=Halobaculum sp. MBLA0143 TaxID=3079933 RepID=UPI00352554C2
MSDNSSQGSGVSRRRFVKAAGASGAVYGLAGCAGGGGGSDGGETEQVDTEPPSEKVTVELATDSNFKSAGDQIVQSMRDHGGLPDTVDIEWTAGSFESGDRQAKYQQLLNAGNASPAIMMMDNGWTIPFIARDQLTNLSQALPDEITSTVKDDYVQTMVGTAMNQDGDLFGVPLFADFPTIQYRKDVLREAGYSDADFDQWSTEPMTWSEFSSVVAEGREALDGMLDAGTTAQGFNWQGKAYVGLACCDMVEFMGSWGGSYFGEFGNLFGPVGDRPVTVDDEQVVDAIRMMRTFIYGSDDPVALDGYEQISPKNVVSYTEEPSRTPFTKGRAVALRNWPYSININGTEENFGEDLGVMPMPYAVGADESQYGPEIGGSTSALGGWHLALNPNAPAEKKNAAYHVFKALQTDQVRLDLFEIGGWIPPIPDLIDTEQTRQLDLIGRYVDSLAVASENAVPRPVTAVWPQQSSKVSQEVNASLRQQKTPADAMSSLKETIQAIEEQGSS